MKENRKTKKDEFSRAFHQKKLLEMVSTTTPLLSESVQHFLLKRLHHHVECPPPVMSANSLEK